VAFPVKQDSVVTNPGGTGSSIVPVLASHAANDEIEIWVTKTGNAAWSAPANWTIKHQVISPGTATTATVGTLLYRRVLSTDTLPLPNPTCNLGATVTRHAIARTIRGADIEGVYITPSWSATAIGSGTANPIRPASVTTPAPEMLVTHYYCQRVATNAPEPSGYTQDQEVITSGTLVTNVSQKNVSGQSTILANQDASPTSGGRWASVITCAPSIDYPYYRSGSQATATGTSVTPARPTGTTNSDQRGNKDVMIATVEASGTANVDPVDFDLWQEITTWTGVTSGNGTTVKKFWCYATASPNMTFTRETSGEISVCVTTYYNCHQTNPIGNSDADPRASSTTSTWDAVTRSSARCVMQATCVADATPSFTSPAGWIERMDGLGIACSDQTFQVADVTGADSFTLSAGSPTLVGLVEIRNLMAADNVTVTPTTLNLTITKFAPTLRLTITPAVKNFTTAGFAPKLAFTLMPTLAALTTTWFALSLELRVTPSTQSLVLTTFVPTVDTGGGQETVAIPATASLTLSTFASALALSVVPDSISLTLSEFAPALELVTIPATTGLNLSGFASSVNLGDVPSTASLVTAGFAPVLELKTVPLTANLSVLGFANNIGLGVIPSPASLTLGTFAPTIETQIIPIATSLTLSVLAPTLETRIILNTASLTIETFGLSLNSEFIPQVTGLTLTASTSALDLGLVPQPAVLILSTSVPVLDLRLTPQATNLTLTTSGPSLGGEVTITSVTAILNLTTFSVQLSETVIVGATGLILTGFTPQLEGVVIPQTQLLATVMFAPQLLSGITPQAASLTITPFAPTVTTAGGQALTITPSTEQLFLNEFTPNVLAFHVRSEAAAGREVRTVQVGRESRTLDVF
jgi:hypothetical protein